MTVAEIQALARAWIAHEMAGRNSAARERWLWASDRLSELPFEAPEQCWEVIQEIFRLEKSDLILSNLAAGPIEELLSYHGDALIDRIESLARSDPQFSRTLGNVWQNRIPDHVWKRVRQVAGPSW